VAVKQVLLQPGLEDPDEARSRARREARAAARLVSPSVVAVYDAVEESDALWLVMELVQAPNLQALVRRQGPLDEHLAACIGQGVLDALEAAHAVGVVHRDVKPANVLVGPAQGAVDAWPDVTVKLADFGVAALPDDSRPTRLGLVTGSPSYMAPEQALAREVGPPADLWALGALLYFAVEGEPPFVGASALATAVAVVHSEPRAQQQPGRLSRLIELLLDKAPERRPHAARARAILRSVATGEPAAATTASFRPVTIQGGLPATAAGPTRRAHPWATASRVPGSAWARRSILAAAALLVVVGGAANQLAGGGDGSPGTPPAHDVARDAGSAAVSDQDTGSGGTGGGHASSASGHGRSAVAGVAPIGGDDDPAGVSPHDEPVTSPPTVAIAAVTPAAGGNPGHDGGNPGHGGGGGKGSQSGTRRGPQSGS
jgi:hypothetical protein